MKPIQKIHFTILFFFCSVFMILSSVKLIFIFVKTFKTSKQQRQAIKFIPVTIANIESKSKEVMGKIITLNLLKINMQVYQLYKLVNF